MTVPAIARRARLVPALAGIAVGLSAGYMMGSIGREAPHAPATMHETRTTTTPRGRDHAAMPHAGRTPDDPASRAYLEASARMHAAMNAAPTGDADLDFARGMIPHHKGAVDMARIELRHGSDPDMRALAADVVRTQETEISRMRGWIAKRAGDVR